MKRSALACFGIKGRSYSPAVRTTLSPMPCNDNGTDKDSATISNQPAKIDDVDWHMMHRYSPHLPLVDFALFVVALCAIMSGFIAVFFY